MKIVNGWQEFIDNEVKQSISAKGSSVDNVPIESFFSILKSECIYLIVNLYKKILIKLTKTRKNTNFCIIFFVLLMLIV